MAVPTRSRRVLARALLGVSELLLTGAVLTALYAVYLLSWTNVTSARAADDRVSALRAEWQSPPLPKASAPSHSRSDRSPPTMPSPATSPNTIAPGATPFHGTFALMRIPRLDSHWVQPVVEGSGADLTGISLADLAEGIVHYPRTAAPGEIGNFAVAGHRATHGEPFRDLDRLRPGDHVYVDTRERTYDYQVSATAIVDPSAIGVLDPVPNRPGVQADAARITLTTCDPRWGSTHRLIVYGTLAGASAAGEG